MKTLLVTPIEQRHLDLIKDLDITVIDRNNYREEDILDAEVVLGNFPLETLLRMKNLKWVQLDFAGVGDYANLDENVILTNASGAYGLAISEHLLAYTLAISKRMFDYLDNQVNKEYKQLEKAKSISDLKILCVGTGDIGQEYGKRMKSLGARVFGVNRRGTQNYDIFEKIYPVSLIDEAIEDVDVIAISLPGTSKTYHLFNEELLAKTKKDAILINVGRGSVIDTDALIKLQNDNHFMGVALDVFEKEPLPKDHPLWNVKNVYITPHISGKYDNVAKTQDLVINLMLDNYKRYINNQELLHIVNKKEGY